MRTAQLKEACLLPTAFCFLRSLSDGSCDAREIMKILGALVSLPARLVSSATQAGKDACAPGGVFQTARATREK